VSTYSYFPPPPRVHRMYARTHVCVPSSSMSLPAHTPSARVLRTYTRGVSCNAYSVRKKATGLSMGFNMHRPYVHRMYVRTHACMHVCVPC
jgi:hypothetical protein